MEILKNWVCSGYLDDNYEEFMVCSNQMFLKENIGEHYNELYWEKKYTLNNTNVRYTYYKIKFYKKFLL
jgi:hypothetical protein